MDMPGLVADIFRTTLNNASLADDDDFFDSGANSLTLVELQIRIEKILALKVPTSQLMLHSTIGGWVAAYRQAALTAVDAPVA